MRSLEKIIDKRPRPTDLCPAKVQRQDIQNVLRKWEIGK